MHLLCSGMVMHKGQFPNLYNSDETVSGCLSIFLCRTFNTPNARSSYSSFRIWTKQCVIHRLQNFKIHTGVAKLLRGKVCAIDMLLEHLVRLKSLTLRCITNDTVEFTYILGIYASTGNKYYIFCCDGALFWVSVPKQNTASLHSVFLLHLLAG